MVLNTQIVVLYFLIYGFFVRIQFCHGLIFPGNSAYGLFAAIAIPLNIPHHDVFVSYNFEANYNLPSDAPTILPGIYQKFTPEEEITFGDQVVDETDSEAKGRKATDDTKLNYTHAPLKKPHMKTKSVKKAKESKEPLITRRAIYHILEEKLKTSGFNGKGCLLKMICEVNASLLGKNNGVLGSILHILLTPSTSYFENLPRQLYNAEENGINGDCFQYEKKCAQNIMDIFSVTIKNILNSKM